MHGPPLYKMAGQLSAIHITVVIVGNGMGPAKKCRYEQIPADVSLHIRYLHQDKGVRGKDLRKRYKKYSKTSIYRHMVKPIGEEVRDKREDNAGRPKVYTSRETRQIIRPIGTLRR